MKIKTKKVGVYYYLTETDDKIFYFNYKDIADGKLKWVKVGSYKDGYREANAVELRAEQISKMKNGKDIRLIATKKKKIITTLDNLAQIYFNDKKIGKDRISKYKTYIYPKFGNKDIFSIKKQQLKDFFNDISKSGKANQTVNGIRELFSAIINHNIKQRELKYINPLVGIPRLNIDNDRERFLNLEEITQLKEAVKDNHLLSLFVNLSLLTGGRISTIVALQKKDFNLSTSTVTLKNIKTNSTYTGFLNKDIIKDLKVYLDTLNINDYVVSLDDNKQITSRIIQGRLKPKIDKLFNSGLDIKDAKNRVVLHTLRHTFASHLAINGIPIFTIQNLMNHSDIKQTLRYAKLSPENGKIAIQGLYQ
jgi:integrase